MTHAVRVILSALAVGMFGAGQAGVPKRAPIDISKLGPQIGERVPDFDLQDQYGKAWTLKSVLGPRGAMLVFFRSADW